MRNLYLKYKYSFDFNNALLDSILPCLQLTVAVSICENSLPVFFILLEMGLTHTTTREKLDSFTMSCAIIKHADVPLPGTKCQTSIAMPLVHLVISFIDSFVNIDHSSFTVKFIVNEPALV